MFWRGPLPPTYNGASPLRGRTAPKLSMVVGRPPSMDRFTIWSYVTSSTVWNWPSLMVSVLPVERPEWVVEMKRAESMLTGKLWMPRGVPPIDGVSGLAAWIIADFDMTLVELHRNVIVVSVVQEDAVIFSCGHLQRNRVVRGCPWTLCGRVHTEH